MNEIVMRENDARNWGLFTHLASFAGYVFPLESVLGPLVIWLMKKNESSYVDQHGKASLNFQISLVIWSLICIPLCFVLIGFVLLLVLGVVDLVCVILNMVRSTNGEPASYPLSIRFIS